MVKRNRTWEIQRGAANWRPLWKRNGDAISYRGITPPIAETLRQPARPEPRRRSHPEPACGEFIEPSKGPPCLPWASRTELVEGKPERHHQLEFRPSVVGDEREG